MGLIQPLKLFLFLTQNKIKKPKPNSIMSFEPKTSKQNESEKVRREEDKALQ